MNLLPAAISRKITPPQQSFFLLGPRGTGKSTWLKDEFPNAIWIDLLDPEQHRIYGAYPERLRETIAAYPDAKQVVIDEIQTVPQLLPLIHLLIEEKRGLQFIMTGSSGRKLKREGVDLLGGRAVLKTMHPFTAAELQNWFSLEQALSIGLLPLVLGSSEPELVLRNYCGLYLKEEIQAEGLVRNIHQYSRFLEAISFSHGSLINTSNIARECNISRTTVDTYLQILLDLFLAFTLPVFTKRARREVTRHPKFYLFDVGVYRALRPSGPLDRVEEIAGPALEGLIAQHLRAWQSTQSQPHDLYYWRTRTGLEVDFVIYGPNVFCGIEVKNAQSIGLSDLRGLKAFADEYPEAKTIMVYRGNTRRMEQGVLLIPCAELLPLISGDFDFFMRDK